MGVLTIAPPAWIHGTTIATLSFKLTLQITKAFQQAGLLNESNPEIHEKLLEEIICKQAFNANAFFIKITGPNV